MKFFAWVYALACARPTRLNFLFDFRRKGMKESRPFLSYFFLFIYFSFFLFRVPRDFFFFSVFSFSCFILSFPALGKKNAPSFPAQRT